MGTLVAYIVAVRFRNRWRTYAGLVVVIGLFGGLSLFALAGARRTQSSYARFLRTSPASTMSVSDGRFDPKVNAAVAALPEVARSRTYVGLGVYALAGGAPDVSQTFEAVGSLDGLFFDQDRFAPTRGRRPDPGRADEVALNELAASRYGYRVGQTIELGTYSDDQVLDPNFRVHPSPPKLVTTAHVVGIGVFPDEVLQDDSDRLTRLLLTPAFTRQATPYFTYAIQGLQLARGNRDVEAVKQRVARLLPLGLPNNYDLSLEVKSRVVSVDEFHALRALRPLSVALFAFGGLSGLAGVVLVSQGVGRVLRADREQGAALRVFGASPTSLIAAGGIGPALAVLAGTALAVGLAFVASPAMPIGPVRRVQGVARFDLDATVMAAGAVIIVLTILGATVLIALFEARQRVRNRNRQPSRRNIATLASDAGVSPVAVMGLSFALGSGDEATTAPTRSVMVGAVVAVAALVASMIFGASADGLVRRPALYGWSGDAAVVAGRGYGNIPFGRAQTILDQDGDIQSWAGAYFGRDRINGSDTPLLGMDVGSPLTPPLLRGRPLARANEIILGSATASKIHKALGDTVTIAGRAELLTVVGIGTFPTIGVSGITHTSLGIGALVAHELIPGFERDITGGQSGGDLGPQVIFARFRRGTNPAAGLAHLAVITQPLADFSGLAVDAVQRPAEITSLGSIAAAPVLLATALAFAAMISLGLALAAAVRRRRRDLAILRSIGFKGRQLAGTVSWLATTMIVVGLGAGVPLGVVIGRSLWDVFAGQLDVLAAPRVPALVLVGLSFATVLVANLIAALPARRARRVSTARLAQRQ
ncbi:MAG: FtsX-like permease family protein [Actinomycetota bacterium]|nr:FtsX-like permease family protein [Actinomycetota bacterium]